ncbi:hypothetical protein [Actinokineospora diospyrosa]|uniref:hypothetical protein n=1 Tax=Actinokineospora diospyrosa TaxID=103728 RepID=UPI0020A610C8|nr:hypothetical protein [Actinokineospora diospyrosa]
MNDVRVWRYEARRAGRHLLAAPPLLAIALLVTGLAAPGAGFTGDWLARVLAPLVAGLATAAVVAGEPAVELHTTLPTPLPTTFARRVALLGGSTLLSAVALALALLPAPAGYARLAAVCGLAVLLMGVGAWAAVALRSTAGASTVVLAAWFADLFVLERVLPALGVRVAVDLVLAVVLAARAAHLLGYGREFSEGARR